MVHEIDCSKKYIIDVLAEIKKFEVRLNDRNYKIGDVLVLKEIDNSGNFTGRKATRIITYFMSEDDNPGIKPGHCVLGIEPIS